MADGTLAWRVPEPLWRRTLAEDAVVGALVPERFAAPSLLRFDNDDFMTDLAGTLAADPDAIADYAVRAETWRSEAVGWQSTAAARAAVTLFQPVQKRFYLVAASLVCQRRGLPDRRVDARKDERAAFVMRRLVPRDAVQFDAADPATYDEYGWFGDRSAGLWLPLDDPRRVHAQEERLPLFPMAYGNRPGRRLWTGLVPVGSREVYDAGARQSLRQPALPPADTDPLADPRVAALEATVVAAAAGLAGLPDPPPPDAELQEALVQLALDLGTYLALHLPGLWAVPDGAGFGDLSSRLQATVAGGSSWLDLARNAVSHETAIRDGDYGAPGLLVVGDPAFDAAAIGAAAGALLGTEVPADPVAGPAFPEYPLVSACRAVLGEPRLGATRSLAEDWQASLDDWPAADADAQVRAMQLALGLADWLAREIPDLWLAIEAGSAGGLSGGALALYQRFGSWSLAGTDGLALLRAAADQRRDILLGEPGAALPTVAAAATAAALAQALQGLLDGGLASALVAALPAEPAGTLPAADEAPEPQAHYRIRCVYERPGCRGLVPATVSEASRPFRLASFFDPDAPTRKVQLRMPVDTSPAGLRRFDKGVSVLLSNKLREQLERVREIQVNADQEVEVVGRDASFDLGLACSFSIPIVTICALIVLMIIVQLLNIVFYWLPYFVICLPLRLGSRS